MCGKLFPLHYPNVSHSFSFIQFGNALKYFLIRDIASVPLTFDCVCSILFPFFLHPCFSFQKVRGLYWLYRRFLCRLSKKFEKNSRNFVFPPWRNGTFELKNQRLTIDKKLSGCMREKSGIRDGCRYGSIRLSLIMPWIAS